MTFNSMIKNDFKKTWHLQDETMPNSSLTAASCCFTGPSLSSLRRQQCRPTDPKASLGDGSTRPRRSTSVWSVWGCRGFWSWPYQPLVLATSRGTSHRIKRNVRTWGHFFSWPCQNVAVSLTPKKWAYFFRGVHLDWGFVMIKKPFMQ